MTDFEIYHEDCLEGMKRIPDGSVDMVLTDPPFGTTDAPWDKPLPPPLLWEQLLRITKLNAAIVLFSQMPFGSDLIQSQRKLFRYEWIWRKNLGTGFLNAKKMPLKCHENILVFYRRLPTYNPQFTEGTPYSYKTKTKSSNYQIARKYRGEIFSAQMSARRFPVDVQNFNLIQDIHPTQKPVDLLEYLIRTYSNEGELILDATMGSGSTGVAAVNTGRRFIGFETEEKFFNIAKERISKAVAQREQALFDLERRL